MSTRSFQLAKILGSTGTIKAAALDSDAVGGGVKLAENDSAAMGAGAAGGLEPTSFFVASGVTVSPSDFRRESAVPRLASTLFFVDEGAVSRDEPEPIKN